MRIERELMRGAGPSLVAPCFRPRLLECGPRIANVVDLDQAAGAHQRQNRHREQASSLPHPRLRQQERASQPWGSCRSPFVPQKGRLRGIIARSY